MIYPKCLVRKLACIKYILLLIGLFQAGNLFAQRDVIFKKDSTQIRCKILSVKGVKYSYAFIDSTNKIVKASIVKSLVDSVRYNMYDSNLVNDKTFKSKEVTIAKKGDEEPVVKPWEFTFGIGLNIGHLLELNPPSGTDKNSFSAT